jgi:hypothetical protein
MQFGFSLEQPESLAPNGKPHAKFTAEEDETLRALVEEFGPVDWMRIAQRMNGRNPRQCKERWLNYLAPTLRSAIWTRDEDRLLLQKVRELGAKWVQIAKFFPNRTDSMVKNRFNRLKRREQKHMALFSGQDPMLIRMCPAAVFWQMPMCPRLPMPVPQPRPLVTPIRVEIPREEHVVEDCALWGDEIGGFFDCGVPDLFDFA